MEDKTSKLANIEQALKANPKLGLVHKALDVSFPSAKYGLAVVRTLDYFVAPKKGLYTAESLQKFMTALIPKEIEKVRSLISFNEDDFYLNFGSLFFQEYHPERKKTEISIRPFPSKAFVRDLLENKISSEHFVRKEILKKYKGFFFIR